MSANVAVIDRLTGLGIALRHYRHGRQRVPCPWCAKGKRDDALSVLIDGEGACWSCWRCEETGAAREDFGKPQGPHPAAKLIAKFKKRKSAEIEPPEPERHETLSARGRSVWANALPIEPGTVAATYLEGRGCMLPPVDGDLRWHPGMPYHVADQREPIHTGPALVGLVTDAETGDQLSIHRTWITATGKADLGEHKPRKLLWNHRSDGVIRLWPDDEITMGLVIGEGIETCLAAARAGLTPCWAAISAGNLAAFPVLQGLDGITVLVDHDRPDRRGRRAGIRAASELVARYVAAGFDPDRDLRIVLPPTEGEDAADLEAAA